MLEKKRKKKSCSQIFHQIKQVSELKRQTRPERKKIFN